VNATGTTSRLKPVDVTSPPITVMAIGCRKLASPPKPSARGTMPAIMATLVIRIGRARLWHASTSASCIESPSSRMPTNV
jgi:hypothetical protein